MPVHSAGLQTSYNALEGSADATFILESFKFASLESAWTSHESLALCPSFLTIPSGEAILDIGATQDLIGAEAAKGLKKRLECCGLQALEVDVPPMIPTGIGGPAKVLQTLLVPISPQLKRTIMFPA